MRHKVGRSCKGSFKVEIAFDLYFVKSYQTVCAYEEERAGMMEDSIVLMCKWSLQKKMIRMG